MATRELITKNIKGEGWSRLGFNVSNTVGIGGRNEAGDVLLIQVMFKYIEQNAPKLTKNTTKGLTAPTGVFDAATARAIRLFQREWSFHLLSQNGLIHPGSFKNRKLQTTGKQMMIMLLNQFVWIAGQGKDLDYTQTVFHFFPQLRLWVKDV